jgi:hypothetical protein
VTTTTHAVESDGGDVGGPDTLFDSHDGAAADD